MTCTFCGEENEHGAQTCIMCGERIQKAVDAPLPATPPPSTVASANTAPPMPSQVSPYQSATLPPPSSSAPPSPGPLPQPAQAPPGYPFPFQPAPPPQMSYPPPWQPIMQPVSPLYYVPTYVAPPGPPGRGFGIASLVLGIIGILFSLSVLIAVFSSVSSYYRYYYSMLGEVLTVSLIHSPLTILACIFSGVALSKGYRTGVSKSGLVLSMVSFGFIIVTIVLCL